MWIKALIRRLGLHARTSLAFPTTENDDEYVEYPAQRHRARHHRDNPDLLGPVPGAGHHHDGARRAGDRLAPGFDPCRRSVRRLDVPDQRHLWPGDDVPRAERRGVFLVAAY